MIQYKADNILSKSQEKTIKQIIYYLLYVVLGRIIMINGLQWKTSEEINIELAERVKNIRKRRGISQENLSKLSGVSHGSIKRFENTGMISLLSLTKIAIALGCAGEVESLFSKVEYGNIQEVINENK